MHMISWLYTMFTLCCFRKSFRDFRHFSLFKSLDYHSLRFYSSCEVRQWTDTGTAAAAAAVLSWMDLQTAATLHRQVCIGSWVCCTAAGDISPPRLSASRSTRRGRRYARSSCGRSNTTRRTTTPSTSAVISAAICPVIDGATPPAAATSSPRPRSSASSVIQTAQDAGRYATAPRASISAATTNDWSVTRNSRLLMTGGRRTSHFLRR